MAILADRTRILAEIDNQGMILFMSNAEGFNMPYEWSYNRFAGGSQPYLLENEAGEYEFGCIKIVDEAPALVGSIYREIIKSSLGSDGFPNESTGLFFSIPILAVNGIATGGTPEIHGEDDGPTATGTSLAAGAKAIVQPNAIGSIAFGAGSRVSVSNCTVIGANTQADNPESAREIAPQGSVVIGNQSNSNAGGTVAIGGATQTMAFGGIAVGTGSRSDGFLSTAIGPNCRAKFNLQTRIGSPLAGSSTLSLYWVGGFAAQGEVILNDVIEQRPLKIFDMYRGDHIFPEILNIEGTLIIEDASKPGDRQYRRVVKVRYTLDYNTQSRAASLLGSLEVATLSAGPMSIEPTFSINIIYGTPSFALAAPARVRVYCHLEINNYVAGVALSDLFTQLTNRNPATESRYATVEPLGFDQALDVVLDDNSADNPIKPLCYYKGFVIDAPSGGFLPDQKIKITVQNTDDEMWLMILKDDGTVWATSGDFDFAGAGRSVAEFYSSDVSFPLKFLVTTASEKATGTFPLLVELITP